MAITESGQNRVLLHLACLVIILAGLKAASAIVVPLLFAIFIAIIAYTPIQWLTEHKVPLWLSVILVLLSVVAVIVGIGGLVMQSAFELQAQQAFYEQRLGQLMADLLGWLESLGFEFASDITSWSDMLSPSQIWSLGLSTLSGISTTLSQGFLILLVFIFIIAESSSLPAKIHGIFQDRGHDTEWLNDFARNLNRYIGIKTLFSLLTGTLVTISLWIMGLDFPILWGMLAFMLNYIPNIGSIIAATPAVLLALIQLGPGYAGITVLIYVFINQLVGAFLEPRFLGAQLNMTTLTVFMSLILWGWLFGTVGMLLSVPLTMSIKLATDGRESTAWISHFLSREPTVKEPTITDKPA